jgi:hypothetical protein
LLKETSLYASSDVNAWNASIVVKEVVNLVLDAHLTLLAWRNRPGRSGIRTHVERDPKLGLQQPAMCGKLCPATDRVSRFAGMHSPPSQAGFAISVSVLSERAPGGIRPLRA